MSKFSKATIFTTGQVAKLCQVSPRTVTKWFDSGQLKGYRIPGSQDRRIPQNSLVTFLSNSGMPLGELSTTTKDRVLIVGNLSELGSQLSENSNLEVLSAHTTFEAGSAAVKFEPNCVVLDTKDLQQDLPSLIAGLRRVLNKQSSIIGLLDESTNDSIQDLFDESFRVPFDMQLLINRVEKLASHSKSNG